VLDAGTTEESGAMPPEALAVLLIAIGLVVFFSLLIP
jgi:hypothetical protein